MRERGHTEIEIVDLEYSQYFIVMAMLGQFIFYISIETSSLITGLHIYDTESSDLGKLHGESNRKWGNCT